jgi:hypothetical protein
MSVQIVRFVHSHQPGWVECEFDDAEGRRHTIMDNVPILTLENLDADSRYPRPGIVRCFVLNRYQNDKGEELVRIGTGKPDGIESKEGLSEFTVPASRITSVPD